MKSVMASFRPQERDIAVFLGDGPKQAFVPLEIEEARAIHGALGLALKLADCVAEPVKAVQP